MKKIPEILYFWNLVSTGREACEKFIEEYIEDTERIKKAIKHNKIRIFAIRNATFKPQGKDQEIITIGLIRDLFGSTLFLSHT